MLFQPCYYFIEQMKYLKNNILEFVFLEMVYSRKSWP